MGNSGSVHNINWDSSAGGLINGRSKSELNGYYQKQKHHAVLHDNEPQTQTLLRRQHNQNSQKMDRTKSFPVVSTSEQFKVLPKIGGAERHKLRATTNGMLLHAGGTISGRNKDDLRVPGQMQRSRTLIFDKRDGDGESGGNNKSAIPSFQRSQTLLHLPYKERSNEELESNKRVLQKNLVKEEGIHGRSMENQNLRHSRSEPDFRNDLNKPTHTRKSGLMNSTNVPPNSTQTKSTKLNKYNKKRKAPPAPPLAATTTQSAGKADDSDNTGGEKAPVVRRFRTNSNVKSQQQQQTAPQILKVGVATPLYRREKSCDAILLRSKAEGVESTGEKRFSLSSKMSENRQLSNVPSASITPSPVVQSLHSQSPTVPKQASKIPQLKRTFYFGMQTGGAVDIAQTKILNAKPKKSEDKQNHIKVEGKSHTEPLELQTLEKTQNSKDHTVLATPAIVIASEDVAEFKTLKYRLHHDKEFPHGSDNHCIDDEESQINDNGILVHIRPALPRKQLEVPSFSPAAAWRMLSTAEDERHKQLQRSPSGTLICESPIQLRNNKLDSEIEEVRREQPSLLKKTLRKDNVHTMTWTPQQDLGDDDDDDINHEMSNDSSSSEDFDGAKDEGDGLLFFNGRPKNGRNEIGSNTKNNDNNLLGVHLFSLSLPRDTHLDTHMQKKNSMVTTGNDKITGFSSLQKLKLTISGGSKCTCRTSITKLITNNIESSTDPEICEIHNSQMMFRSDNWVLHKTATGTCTGKSKEGATNDLTKSNSRKLLKDDLTPTVEPLSLSYLTGGKHIMYLPGITAPVKNSDNEESGQRLYKETTPNRETTKVVSRQRQRKKETRESLQDETPVLRHQQSQSQPQTQRFSFQSTVRMLEKRRLAEKLSRDAEIREAQRKSELEAMKRVEEDFQRKRASEKANIRQQLRLYCSGSGADANAIGSNNEQYNSLPVFCGNRQQHDTNNNKISVRRADPDGAAASPPPPFILDTEPHRFVHEISHLPLKRMGSDCGDSDTECQNADIMHFNRTASMVEPYLQSFMKDRFGHFEQRIIGKEFRR